MLLQEQTFVRHIQGNQRDRYAGMEDDMRGVRIHVNIELSLWRDIAVLQDRPAHNDKFFYSFCKAWFFADGYGDVCEWSNGKDADLVRLGKDTFDQVIDCML